MRVLKQKASQADTLGVPHKIRVTRKYKCPECKGWHLTSKENQ